MPLDSSEFLPSPSDWYSTTVEYEGWGRAEFADPEGSVEGPTCVTFDELGGASIEMRPDLRTLHAERTLRFGLTELLTGVSPKTDGGVASLTWNLASENPCVNLEVATPQGRFSTRDVLRHGRRKTLDDGDQERMVERIFFDVFASRFDTEEDWEPRYWVLPLINFIPKWRQMWAELDRHPLRIFPTPEVPDEITHVPYGPDEERAKNRAISALVAANSKNRLIAFEFNEAPGFVERLPDYEDRKEDLFAGKERMRPTAIMVGEAGSNPVETLDEVERWLRPQDLLMLLTLATGTEVGASWIELRNDQGRLVRRFHRRLREAQYSRGRRVVDDLPFKDGEGRDTGIGYLITRAASKSKELGQSALRTAILHLVRSKYQDQSLDESMAHLCRGLDGLCEHYGLAKQNLTRSLNADQAEVVKEALAEASRKIRNLRNTARNAGDDATAATLSTIEQRVQNAANVERKFGLALADLLERFGMPDTKVIDEHYKTKPRADKREHWTDVVSHYRTDVIHYGYLDLDAGGHDWRDVWAIINHLHDVMARVILSALEYDGGYQPTVVPQPSVPFPLSWVKADTEASALGYGWDYKVGFPR